MIAGWVVPLASSLLGAFVGALALFMVYRAERVNGRVERFEEAMAV